VYCDSWSRPDRYHHGQGKHNNPIEQAFAKIKHWMRSAQKRTIEHAWRHIGSLVETIDPTECNNYFANAGYASVKK